MTKFQMLKSLRLRERGVTLIELMVGMTIGLLSVVIITQVMVNSENQKRTTTSGADAQVNGALALETLQREIRSSGYGLIGDQRGLGCQVKGSWGASAPLDAASWLLTPVRIVQGASGLPDSIRVMSSDSKSFAVPYPTAEDHDAGSTSFVMRNEMTGYTAVGDLFLVIPSDFESNPSTWCTVVSAFPAPAGSRVYHTANAASAPWNVAPPMPADGYKAGSILVNAGTFVNREYSVVANQLQRRSFSSATGAFLPAEVLFPQVVDLQAVYGKSGATLGEISVWEEKEPATPIEWQQLLAVRVAVLARSGQIEKEDVTLTEPVWYPDGVTATKFKITTLPDWRKYRYKVYETVVPLRNMIWHTKNG